MTIFYSVNVKIPMSEENHNSLEVETIINKISKEFGGGNEHINYEDGTLVISINNEMTYSSAEELDDTIKELGPFASEGATVYYDCDDGEGEFVIGPDENSIAKRTLSDVIENITEEAKQLTPIGHKETFDKIVELLDKIKPI